MRALLKIHKNVSCNLYSSTSCSFSMSLNDNSVDIEKPNGICLASFVKDEFSVLFLHPSIFSIKHSRSA